MVDIVVGSFQGRAGENHDVPLHGPLSVPLIPSYVVQF